MPRTAGAALRSSSLNSLAMLTVERTRVEASTHDAALPDDAAARRTMENTH
jgi:hypothetical protein